MTNVKPRSRRRPAVGSFFLAGLLILPAILCVSAGETPRRKMRLLTGALSVQRLRALLLPPDKWQPFPAACNRKAWKSLLSAPLNRARRSYVIREAEKLLHEKWPPLPATLYMEFARTGNRSHYERFYFKRRRDLAVLVLAECFEHRGRFLDQIANVLWAICEESTWCLPAHASRYPGDVLHRPDIQSLDLFACETGMTLALARYILAAELRNLSRALFERVGLEVERRITKVYESGDDFGCAGWIRGYNNWAPWCASNVLGALFLLERDGEKLASAAFRLMQVADRFIDNYGQDGGCDEGPSYWNQAGGALLVFLELLGSRTGGKIAAWDVPKIRAMGEYIARVHLTGPYFANFADADAKPGLHPAKLYCYGERISCDRLKALAGLIMRGGKTQGTVDPPLKLSGVSTPLLGPLAELFWMPPRPPDPHVLHDPFAWFPDVQHFVAHQFPQPERGLVLAAKAGHNAESHNHNDVGHFMIYLDGSPAVVDVGRETYTRQTFSSRRYELWFTRGRAHNAPVVNGIEQKAGSRFRATHVQFKHTESKQELSMHLEKAYPAEARLKQLKRTIVFERAGPCRITVTDSLVFSRPGGDVCITLYTPGAVKRRTSGALDIDTGGRSLLLRLSPDSFRIETRMRTLPDPLMQKSWGGRLNEIIMRMNIPRESGSYSLSFQAASH